jgi:hypothetical protein
VLARVVHRSPFFSYRREGEQFEQPRSEPVVNPDQQAVVAGADRGVDPGIVERGCHDLRLAAPSAVSVYWSRGRGDPRVVLLEGFKLRRPTTPASERFDPVGGERDQIDRPRANKVLGARDGFCSKPLNQAAIVNPDMAPFGSVYWSRGRGGGVRVAMQPSHGRLVQHGVVVTKHAVPVDQIAGTTPGDRIIADGAHNRSLVARGVATGDGAGAPLGFSRDRICVPNVIGRERDA